MAGELSLSWMNDEANEFAMNLLVPTAFLQKDLADGIDLCDEAAVATLAKRYRVSVTVMALRIGQVRAILGEPKSDSIGLTEHPLMGTTAHANLTNELGNRETAEPSRSASKPKSEGANLGDVARSGCTGDPMQETQPIVAGHGKGHAGSNPVIAAEARSASAGTAQDEGWITIECERALYVDEGKTKVLCDRLPSPVTLVLKLNLPAAMGKP